jgi:hypothetical protein
VSDDDKIVRLTPRCRATVPNNSQMLRTLARAIREMREGGSSSKDIARVLRQAAGDLDHEGDKPA